MEYNIEDIIKEFGEYFKSRKANENGFVCRSVYTEDKTPSMHIDITNNRFYCFSACKGGGPLQLLNALQFGKFKIDVEESGMFSLSEIKDITTLTEEEFFYLNVLNKITDYTSYELRNNDNNKDVVEYLKKRKIKNKTVTYNKLGFFPSEVDFKEWAKLQQISEEYLIKIGVFNIEGNLLYLGRIVIPVFDKEKNIIDLEGRNINDNVSPKYLRLKDNDELELKTINRRKSIFNSRDSFINITNQQEIIIVEGIFDVLRLQENDRKNAIAIRGKVITDQVISFLKEIKNLNSIIMFLDQDVEAEVLSGSYIRLKENEFRNITYIDYSIIAKEKKRINLDPDTVFKEFEYSYVEKNLKRRNLADLAFEYNYSVFSMDLTFGVYEFLKIMRFFERGLSEEEITRLKNIRPDDTQLIINDQNNSFSFMHDFLISQELNIKTKFYQYLKSEIQKKEVYFYVLQELEYKLGDTINNIISSDNYKLNSMPFYTIDIHPRTFDDNDHWKKGQSQYGLKCNENNVLKVVIDYNNLSISLQSRVSLNIERANLKRNKNFYYNLEENIEKNRKFSNDDIVNQFKTLASKYYKNKKHELNEQLKEITKKIAEIGKKYKLVKNKNTCIISDGIFEYCQFNNEINENKVFSVAINREKYTIVVEDSSKKRKEFYITKLFSNKEGIDEYSLSSLEKCINEIYESSINGGVRG